MRRLSVFFSTLIRRLVYLAVTLLALHAILFMLFRFLPSGLGALFGWGSLDSRFREAMSNELGLGGSYAGNLKSVLQFNFGYTLRGRFPVAPVLGHAVLRSLPLFAAIAVGALAGPVAAAWSHVYQGMSASPRKMRLNAGIVNLPPFVVAAAAYAAYHMLTRATDPALQVATLWTAAMLASALFPFLVTHALASRAAQILTAAQFFRSLRAMGLSHHELRNAILPMLFSAIRPAAARVAMSGMLSTAFVELLFGIPGYGRLGLQALQDSDFSLMFGWVLTAAGVVLVFAEVERWPFRRA